MHPGSRRHSSLFTQWLAHPKEAGVPTTLGRVGNHRHPSRGDPTTLTSSQPYLKEDQPEA